MGQIHFGVVADDFTGASDAASFLVAAGVPTVLLNGCPKTFPKLTEDVQAVVIALKSRTEPAAQAVEESLQAFRALKEMGARQLYFKYCSTFDSTEDGNIGPVADAVLREWQIPYTLLCPALPVNGRCVLDGILYVNGVPLSESPMRNHPLTPMRESSLVKLMEMQSCYQAAVISREGICADLPAGNPALRYFIPDYENEADADAIAAQFGDLPFLTGGSGLLGALGRRFVKCRRAEEPGTSEQSASAEEGAERETAAREAETAEDRPALVLAGSCSAMTLRQIADFTGRGASAYRLLPEQLLDGRQNAEKTFEWVQAKLQRCLVYSSAEPADLEKSQQLGKERVAAKIEETLAGLAVLARDAGYTRIIVAGGETSGAVTRALGYQAFRIGESVAPGVPIMTPLENPSLQLVLKSGNFGQPDFFTRAVEMLNGHIF